MSLGPKPHGKRLLICGAVYPRGIGGGLPLALSDLAASLTAREWEVDLAITPEDLDFPAHARGPARFLQWNAPRWRMLPRLRFLPEHIRTAFQYILLDGGAANVQSDLVRAIDARITRQHYDAVIAYVPREVPGLARFILARHPNVMLLSLNGLGLELQLATWLCAARLSAWLAGSGRLHPCVYRAVDPGDVRMAVFASDAWREQAVRAGLPPRSARTIYFGAPCGPQLPDPRPVDGSLLWVGRCSPEKGLHYFIDAVALLRRSRPVTLTAVCAPGPDDYLRSIVNRIQRLGLRDAVRLVAPVPRVQLGDIYASHDALLFYSPFDEPVALVLVEAFAAGIPVAAPRPPTRALLIEPDRTCACFATTSAHDIAATVERILDNGDLRRQVRQGARDLAVRRFSLEAMGEAFDAALDELLGRAASQPMLCRG